MRNTGRMASRARWRGRVFVAVALVAVLCESAGVARATVLPDGRAYELVSPPDKNGGEVMINAGRTRVSSSGDAVSFTSLAGFGDVRGMEIATEYMGVRDGAPETNGWAAHAITPPQDPFTLPAAFQIAEPLYFGDFSPDLSAGVFRAWSLLAPAPNVKRVENLYVRTDLRTPGAGSYTLVSNATAPVGSDSEPLVNLAAPLFAAASADFGHVVFESAYPLTPDATAQATSFGRQYNLYDWDHGTLHLAGVLPDGSAAASSIAGQGVSLQGYPERTVSADGSHVLFTDNSLTNNSSGDLYVRINDATTVQINASERTDCADHDPCSGTPEPEGSQPATFGTANVDGSRVFFVSGENLTDDATGGDRKLYMYDASKPDSDPHNLTMLSVDHQPADPGDVQGVIGASDDGRYVYFVATGQLVAGSPVLNGHNGIYLWHDDGTPSGTVSYVGELANEDDVLDDVPTKYSLSPVQSRVSPDGRHLLLASHSGVGLLSAHGGVDYDHGHTCGSFGTAACEELYVYDADTQQLRCTSCNPTGAPATRDARITISANFGGSETTPHVEHALSDDGRWVFFTTGEALVPQDTNGRLDAYEYDTSDGSVHLLSTGTDSTDSYFVDSSAKGDDAFIATRSQLVGWDTDSSYDIYDARVHGGFPEPPPAPVGCVGDGCHGPFGAPPAASLPGSSAITGDGNVKAGIHRSKPKPVKCRRGFVRKRVRGKVRCVKKGTHAAKKAKRATSAGGAR